MGISSTSSSTCEFGVPCAGSEPSGVAQRATTLGLLLTLAALPLGCTRDTGSSARNAGSPPRDLTIVGADSLLGDIRRVARFDAAPSTLAVPGLVPGRPFVAIVVAVPADASERPGDQGDTYEIVCFLGRMPLTRVPQPELADAVLLVGPDPGDDTAGVPVWCARRSRGAGRQGVHHRARGRVSGRARAPTIRAVVARRRRPTPRARDYRRSFVASW